MISQRFNLFYAGYTASLPCLFFHKQKIKESILSRDSLLFQAEIGSYFKTLEDDKPEYDSHLTSAINLASTFELSDFEIPSSSDDYFKWLEDYVFAFENKFPMGRMEHYYFLFARKLAEMLANLDQIKTYVDLQLLLKESIDYNKQIENLILNCEFIVFKLMAPAALLSGEPRQGCFNSIYKLMSEEVTKFKPFKEHKLDEMSLQKLKLTAEDFKILIVNGFKKCIETLNKLSNE